MDFSQVSPRRRTKHSFSTHHENWKFLVEVLNEMMIINFFCWPMETSPSDTLPNPTPFEKGKTHENVVYLMKIF